MPGGRWESSGPAEGADPATMLRPDGRCSDIISFSCVFRGRQTAVHYLNDTAVDTLEIAKAITWIGRGVPYHPCFNNVTATGTAAPPRVPFAEGV